jgi:hypothetical protein
MKFRTQLVFSRIEGSLGQSESGEESSVCTIAVSELFCAWWKIWNLLTITSQVVVT